MRVTEVRWPDLEPPRSAAAFRSRDDPVDSAARPPSAPVEAVPGYLARAGRRSQVPDAPAQGVVHRDLQPLGFPGEGDADLGVEGIGKPGAESENRAGGGDRRALPAAGVQRFDRHYSHPAAQGQLQDLTPAAVEWNAVPLSHDLTVGGEGAGLVETGDPVGAGDGQGHPARRVGDRAPGVVAPAPGNGAGELDGQTLDRVAQDRGLHPRAARRDRLQVARRYLELPVFNGGSADNQRHAVDLRRNRGAPVRGIELELAKLPSPGAHRPCPDPVPPLFLSRELHLNTPRGSQQDGDRSPPILDAASAALQGEPVDRVPERPPSPQRPRR